MQIGKRPLDAMYAESIKPIRNQMRRYDYQSLLDVMLVYLNAPSTRSREKDLKRLPWVVERLAIWLFADKTYEYGAKIAGEQDLKRLIDLAWNAADKGYGKGQPIKQLGLFVRQAMLPQAPYQQTLDSHAYGLQIHLLKKLPANSNLREFLNAKAGMPIEDYFEVALLYWSHSTTAKPWFNEKFISDLEGAFSEETQIKFLKSITQRVEDFQELCRARTIQVDEWFQPTYFYKIPCIWHRGAAVPLGPQTLRRHFQALIADWIAESNRNDLRQDFDKLVETYVAETLCRGQLAFIKEAELKKLITVGQVSDFLVDEPRGVVLFEVKNKGLSQAVPASRDPLELASRLKATIVKAKSQLADTEKSLRLLPQYRDKNFYRIVVTSNDLWLSSAELLLSGEDNDSKTWLVSLQELDMLTEVVKSKTYSFSQIFADFEENQKSNLAATFSITAFLERLNLKPDTLPSHLLKEFDVLFEKINSRLT